MTNETNFIFSPVSCKQGRKWRGELAYRLSDSPYTVGAWGTVTYRMWDPKALRFVYVNGDFLVGVELDQAKIEADRKAYIDHTIKSTLDWCRQQTPNEDEARKFARNLLLKKHRELLPWFDAELPDRRDVVAAIERTLQWALNLRTKSSMRLYGKMCEGGKPYPKSRIVKVAYSALQKKGYHKLEGFQESWTLMTKLMSLPSLTVVD